jgi:hypothetical protein
MHHLEIRLILVDVVLMMPYQPPQPPTQHLPTMVVEESEIFAHWPSWEMKSP